MRNSGRIARIFAQYEFPLLLAIAFDAGFDVMTLKRWGCLDSVSHIDLLLVLIST
jgi:hypothetical protein